MKTRIFNLIVVSLLLFHTSCNEGVMELGGSGVEQETRVTEEKYRILSNKPDTEMLMLITHWHYAIAMGMALIRVILTCFTCMPIIARKQEMG